MSNTGLYVKLDPESFERLRKRAAEDRRTPGDQAAVLLRKALEALAQNEPVAA
jgi:hypothetical protein